MTGIRIRRGAGWLTEEHGLVRVAYHDIRAQGSVTVTVDGVVRYGQIFGDVGRRGWVVAFETDASESLAKLRTL